MQTNNQTTVDQIVKTIRAGIERGTFKVGQRLPAQRQLSEMFGVSRLVIREAVKVLEGQDILISRQGSGSYIKQNPAELPVQNYGEANCYNLQEIIELCEIIWESSVGKLVRTMPRIEILTLLERCNYLYDNFSQVSEQQKFIYESSFGLSFCKQTGNKLVYNLMLELLKVTSTIDYEIITHHKDYRDILLIDKKLLESILERDAQRARFWSRERDREIARIVGDYPGVLNETCRMYMKVEHYSLLCAEQ